MSFLALLVELKSNIISSYYNINYASTLETFSLCMLTYCSSSTWPLWFCTLFLSSAHSLFSIFLCDFFISITTCLTWRTNLSFHLLNSHIIESLATELNCKSHDLIPIQTPICVFVLQTLLKQGSTTGKCRMEPYPSFIDLD